MAMATANSDEQTASGNKLPQQAAAARAYQKASLTAATEDEILDTYAPVISQMVHRFVPLVKVTVDIDDLKNIASLALIQAAHGFDPAAACPLRAMHACGFAERSSMKSANHSPSRARCIRAARSWKIALKRSAWN